MKNNIRSFRYSDRVAEILRKQKGNSLNEKFENLVLYCHDSVPVVNKQLMDYEKRIAELKEKYSALISTFDIYRIRIRSLDSLINKIDLLEADLNSFIEEM